MSQSEINIRIKQCIIHILNTEMQIPVLSDQEIELSHEIEEYIFNHLKKYIQNDVMKTCYFHEERSNVYSQIQLLMKDTESFVPATKTMAYELYAIMLKYVDIPSADVIFTTFECDKMNYLGILKMNYKASYIHYVEEEQNHHANQIIKQRTALPTDSQKLDEVILINLDTKEIKLLEKRYEINGDKDYYLSTHFLKCDFNKSNKEKFDIVNNTLNAMNKKYFDADIEQSMNVKKAMLDSVEEKGVIDINKVVETAFEDNIELRQEFTEKIQEKGLEDTYVGFEAAVPKKIEKQIIKTDTGIEINIPMDQYGDVDFLEFVNNPDGTISIIIKSIQKITGR